MAGSPALLCAEGRPRLRWAAPLFEPSEPRGAPPALLRVPLRAPRVAASADDDVRSRIPPDAAGAGSDADGSCGHWLIVGRGRKPS